MNFSLVNDLFSVLFLKENQNLLGLFFTISPKSFQNIYVYLLIPI